MKPLYKSIETITHDSKVSNSSPILEMVKYAALNSLYDSKSNTKNLIFVSDMLHHTKTYSHYKGDFDYEKFSQSSYGINQAPLLSDVNITILYLNRPKYNNLQTRSHIGFWEKHFNDNGGYVSHVLRVN